MAVVTVTPSELGGLALLGLVAGLALFGRGLLAYRRGSQVSTLSTSRIASLAAGEVRVTGTVRPGPLTLVSPLQTRPCVYFHARVVEHDGRQVRTLLDRRRAVGFLVDDGSATVRVFPGGASWDVPAAYHESDGLLGDGAVGLQPNDGPETVGSTGQSETMTAAEREAAVARLLTVRSADDRLADSPAAALAGGSGPGPVGGVAAAELGGTGREYTEVRLEPGQVVTVIGTARPFADLPDPANPDTVEGPLAAADDPEIAADLAAARASGSLANDPAAAWGNAAIEGFGIGRPVSPPTLDPAAAPEPAAPAAEAAAARGRFDIPPDALVLAAAAGAPLAVFAGSPGEAAGRAEHSFLVGLVGAVLAIGSAVGLALAVAGRP